MIKTKAGVTVDELGSCYFLLGPYNETRVREEVEMIEPEMGILKDVILGMREHGLKVRRNFVSVYVSVKITISVQLSVYVSVQFYFIF